MRITYNIKLNEHITKYASKYFIVCLFFIIGIIIAVVSSNFIGQEIKADLIEYISSFINLLKTQDIDKQELIKQILYNDFKPIFILWLLGATIIGIPLILIYILLEGYNLAFTVSILGASLGISKSLLFTLIAIIPQYVIILPIIFYLAVNGMNFYSKIAKNNFERKNLFYEFYVYTLRTALLGIIMLGVVLFQVYIQPFLIKFLINFI